MLNNTNAISLEEQEQLYTLTLTSGKQLNNLRMNGSYYISDTEITRDMFQDNIYNVKVSDGENEIIHKVMTLVDFREENGQYWFALRDLTSEELERDRIWAAIEYMALMNGTEL